MSKCGLTAAAINLSGGVDSAVSYAIMKHAASLPGSPIKRIVAVGQPIHSSSWALDRARECAAKFGDELFVVDQTDLHTQLSSKVDAVLGIAGGDFAKGQLRSYMRTPVVYYVAQLTSQAGFPCIVMGTGNMDEDGYLLYFCKAGDGMVDLQLIWDLHKSEVFAVGRVLGVPESILVAPPSADLWEGQTDEEEMGVSYDFVELFTGAFLTLDAAGQEAFVASLGPESKAQFLDGKTKVETIHRRNSHKTPPGPKNL